MIHGHAILIVPTERSEVTFTKLGDDATVLLHEPCFNFIETVTSDPDGYEHVNGPLLPESNEHSEVSIVIVALGLPAANVRSAVPVTRTLVATPATITFTVSVIGVNGLRFTEICVMPSLLGSMLLIISTPGLATAAWAVINPLAMITVYTVIFSQIMRAKLPNIDSTFAYSIYLCAGIITWGLFSEIVNKGQNVFIDNANLLKKISFPRLCLPVIVVTTALINFSIIFIQDILNFFFNIGII